MSTAEADLNAAIRQLRASTARLTAVDGEDLVQEALARALSHGVSTDALPWLRVVTRRLAIDRARRSREVASGGSAELDQVISDITIGPEEHLIVREDRLAVRRALATLPPRYRDALLIYGETGDSRLVSEQLGISTNATYTLLSRARERLRGALERAGFVPGVGWFRLQRWQEAFTAGFLAAGLAVGSALAPAPVAPAAERTEDHAPSIVVASAGMAQEAAPVERTAASIGENPAGSVEAPTAEAARTVTTVQVGCVDEESDSGALLGLRVEDGPMRSPVDQVSDVLSEDEANEGPGGCPS